MMDKCHLGHIKQLINEGLSDEKVAEQVPFSINVVRSVRTSMKLNNQNKCEHHYEVLNDDIEVVEQRLIGDAKANIEISGYVIFHCAKCLDIQQRFL